MRARVFQVNAGCNAICLVTSPTAGVSGATSGSDDAERDRDPSVSLREKQRVLWPPESS